MKTIATVWLGTLAYATIRYNVLKGVAWAEWPTFVVNKAAALSALLLVVVFLVRRHKGGAARLGHLLSAATAAAALHVALSLALLGPASYPKFFVDGKPTAAAAASLLLGALAVVGAFARSSRRDANPDPGRALRLGLLAFVPGVHAALLGWEGWLTPSAWPGGLLPITLIAFVAGTIGLLAGAWPLKGGR